MAIAATGQPPTGVVQASTTNLNPPSTLQPQLQTYKSILNPTLTPNELTAAAPIFELHHGEPSFLWEDQDIENMMINEELKFAVVGKFAYGMPEFNELKKQLPLQLDLKGECRIGFLESRHVLFRLSLLEDYVHLLSRPALYIKIGHRLHQMRGLKYEVWFDAKEETSIGVAWISFPGLPPVFFGQNSVFSLARAVGRPLQLDAATKSKSRPSCAKVKVEVDLLAPRPQRLRIGIKNSLNGETRFKWIKIMYDYVPKYCSECRLQGHNEIDCYVLHPDLVPREDDAELAPRVESARQEPLKVLKSGKIVGPLNKAGEGKILVEKDAPVLTQNQGRQGKNFKKYVHPNRNPNAWTRVVNKSKQVTSDAARVNQGETVATTNAFSMLDVVEESRDEVEVGLDQDATVIHQADGGKEKLQVVESSAVAASKDDPSKGGNFVSSTPMQVGTRSWAQEVFKDHPKVDAVGVSVISGTGKNRAAYEVLESQMGVKAGGELDMVVRTAEGRFNMQESFEAGGQTVAVVSQPSASPSDVSNEPVAMSLLGKDLSPNLIGSKAGSFAPPIAPRSGNDYTVAQPTVTTGFEAEGREPVKHVILKSHAAFNEDVSQACEAARECETLSFKDSEGVGVGGAFNIPACSGFNDTQQLSQSRLHEHEVAMFLLDKNCSPSLINNAQISVKSRGELMFDEQPSVLIPSMYGKSCGIKKADILIDEESRGDDVPSSYSTDSHGSAFINVANIDINEGMAHQPSTFHANRIDAALDAFNAVESRGDDVFNVEESRGVVDAKLPSAYPLDSRGSALITPTKPRNDATSDKIASPSLIGTPAISPTEDGIASQGICVENKQASTIPSLEMSTSLDSASVAKPIFFGKDLISTVQLERLCRSASPNFGKSFLNINAPSFVPKSLMQLVPHSKYLPTDDELVKRMDLNDTRGILARQVGSFQERVPQGHYLVEDDDLFEEEELEEESTAHNVSMVAKEGDLSPREIHVNAPKRVRRVRRPLEPTRVQPTRSTKSKSKRSNKSKNSKN